MRVFFDAVEQSFEVNQMYGVIEEIYSGVWSDYTKCLECGYRSEQTTKFYDIQLVIRNLFDNVSIFDLS